MGGMATSVSGTRRTRQHAFGKLSTHAAWTAPVTCNVRGDDRIHARGPHIVLCRAGILEVPLDDGLVPGHRRHVVVGSRHDGAACAGAHACTCAR